VAPGARGGAVVLGLVAVLALATGCGGGEADEAAAVPEGDRKVTVAGDSISVGLGAELREVVDDGTVVKVIGEGGTGLARPDVFDWPTRMATLAREFPPSVLVFSVGSNDAQDLTDISGNTVVTMSEEEAWDTEYAARLAQVFDAFEGTDTEVVWVGHVRASDERMGDGNRRIHRLAEQVAADRPWVRVEDLGELLGSGEDEATDCLLDDGVHLTVECYRDADRALAERLGL
jgi:lysophospholipase L1-like esterase